MKIVPKTAKPEATKTTPESKNTPLTAEQIKTSKALAEQVKKFTRGEGPYSKVL